MKEQGQNKWVVYALIKKSELIYVGCTSNLKLRLLNHGLCKNFDDYIIIQSFDNKKDALIAENAIIRFFSIFQSEKIENSLYQSVTHYKYFLKK